MPDGSVRKAERAAAARIEMILTARAAILDQQSALSKRREVVLDFGV
jgi:hypothetical protein